MTAQCVSADFCLETPYNGTLRYDIQDFKRNKKKNFKNVLYIRATGDKSEWQLPFGLFTFQQYTEKDVALK